MQAAAAKSDLSERPILAIVGATASGKSQLAQRVADLTGATLLSVDSRKIYRGLDIGTAKPSPEIIRRYDYGLIDCADPVESFSAGRFVAEARRIISERRAAGGDVILVGGTGFYLDALIRGLPDLPDIAPAVRRSILDQAAESGWDAIYDEVRQVDPAFVSAIHPADQTRLLRAAELYRQTHRPISDWLETARRNPAPWPIIVCEIRHDRVRLYERIERRSRHMVEQGLFAEVETLLQSGVPLEAPGLNTVGYREATRFLHGDLSRDQAIAAIIRNSRRYAKRQLTWFRHRTYCEPIDSDLAAPQQLTELFERRCLSQPAFKSDTPDPTV
ncbi:MAG TPA: tRNA (adenosine(37)-N6)-dimethylallyltransferase MiaA [candidate division Zixibacteria bacterium]|jgi:tRNA dimethylallyltransferase